MPQRSPLSPIFDPGIRRGSVNVGTQIGVNIVSVTIEQDGAQADPTGDAVIDFDVEFSEPVTGFTAADVTLSGTAGATTAVVSGSGASYTVAVTGMTGPGTVTADVDAGAATAVASGVPNQASTSVDNTVTYTGGPTVTINQGASQVDPIHYGPIIFDVVFSMSVTGFATGDVTLSGTAGATSAVVTGSGATYTVTVSGMTDEGTVIATIAAGVATGGGNANNASTSTDNTVTYVCNDNDDPFTDDFNRPDYGPGVDGLGACWAAENIPSPVVHWGVTSNEMRYTGAAGSFRSSPDMTPRIDFGGPDFTVEFDLVAFTGVFLDLHIKLRSDGVDDYYLFAIGNTGFGGPDLTLSINKVVAGVTTTLNTTTLTNQGSGGASPLIPERVRVSAIGTALKFETLPIGGGSVTTHISITDSAITTGDLVAFRAFSNQNANPLRIDNVSIS